jgi:hypothetical protein
MMTKHTCETKENKAVYLQQDKHVSGGEDMIIPSSYIYLLLDENRAIIWHADSPIMTAEEAVSYRQEHNLKVSHSWDTL